MMLEAGLPMLVALPKAYGSIQDQDIRDSLVQVKTDVERGLGLAQALELNSYFAGGSALALIHTGEESGALPEMISRYAAMETASINDFRQEMAQWAPRLVYALVAGWIAYGLISGSGVGPTLPANLR
jgi:general secretion pathway protein F